MKSSICPWCYAELCYQCGNPENDNCCCKGSHGKFPISDPEFLGATGGIPTEGEISSGEEQETFITDEEKRSVGRPRQDVLSTKSGRRRAGLIAKIPEGYVCEWAKLGYAGGGVVPIIGCHGNLAAALHHGPDKSTINNEVCINLHRICHTCHNRWHELNDSHYGPRPEDNSEYLPTTDYLSHNRLDQADIKEIAKSEKWWSTPKLERKVAYREW